MKSTEYIEWDKLEQIPFCLCRIAEDEENQEIDVYYLDKRVCHDYDHVGHYFRTAIIMFRRIRNITADWVNLKNLWLLRDCIRENFNHGLEVDDLIFEETFDGEFLLLRYFKSLICNSVAELRVFTTFSILVY